MGKQIKGSLYFLITNTRYSLLIFWTILMSIMIVTLFVSYFLKGIDDSFMTLSLTGPIYVYCSILGFITVKEYIPFTIKMGATRKNLFLSIGIFFLGVSVAKAVVANVIHLIVDFINPKIGIDNFTFVHLAYFTNDTWLNRILIDSSITFFFFAVMFVIGLLFYRYGLAGGGIVVGFIVIIILTGVAQGWLIDFFIHLFKDISALFYFQLLGIGVIIYCVSFIFLRKITVVKVR